MSDRPTQEKPSSKQGPTETLKWRRGKSRKKLLSHRNDARGRPPNHSWSDGLRETDYFDNESRADHKEMLVLDLNGTLMHRVSRVLGSAKAIRARPGLDRFLKFATANFAVMVWSSAQPFSVFNMIDMTFGSYESKLVRVWDRRFCNIDGKYFAKSQTIKDLRRITDGYHLGMSPYRSLLGEYDGFLGMCPDKKNHWKLDNILLIDDSEAKALRQKDNHILMSTYEGGKVDTELDLLIKYLQLYIDSKEHHLTLLDYVKEHKWQEFKRVSTREKINEDEISINFQDLAL